MSCSLAYNWKQELRETVVISNKTESLTSKLQIAKNFLYWKHEIIQNTVIY